MTKLNRNIAYLLIVTAMVISLIAGGVSVFGMVLLFAGHAAVVGMMMGSIELGKLVASCWLKLNWTNRKVPLLHRCYLIGAIVVSMSLTSLGLFGFLSSAYLEQSTPQASVQLQADGFQRQIDQKQGEIKRVEARMAQIDRNIETFLNSGSATKGLKASASMKSEKDALQKTLDARYGEVNALNDKLTPLKQAGSEVEAKLGPIKYVAAFFGWNDPAVAVRFIIFMIMSVCDPLAIMLMISGMITLSEKPEEPAIEHETFEEPEGPVPEPAQTNFWTSTFAPRPDLPAAPPFNLSTYAEWAEVEDEKEAPTPNAEPEPMPVVEEPDFPTPAEWVAKNGVPAVDPILSLWNEPEIEPTEHHLTMTDAPDMGPIDDVIFPDTTPDRDWSQPIVVPDNMLREFEADRVVEDEQSDRDRLISMLERSPDFLQEVVDVVDEIRREQEAAIIAMNNGSGLVADKIVPEAKFE